MHVWVLMPHMHVWVVLMAHNILLADYTVDSSKGALGWNHLGTTTSKGQEVGRSACIPLSGLYYASVSVL
jgi:hypothetical protein